MEELQCIYDASRVGYHLSAGSIVDKLLEAKWCVKNDLIQAFKELDSIESPSIATFFQLPYPIGISNEWIELRGDDIPDPKICFKVIGTNINEVSDEEKTEFKLHERTKYSGHNKFVNGFSRHDHTGSLIKTQVIMVFKLWRFWNEVFPEYEKTYFSRIEKNKPLAFRGGYAQGKDVALTAGVFEYELAKRLRAESLFWIKKILPIYSVSCRDPIPVPSNYLFNFFSMARGGRILTLGPGRSFISDIVNPYPKNETKEKTRKFHSFLKNGRGISIYEQYLLNALRQIESGSTSLAIVYTVMILEWFANEIIEDHFLSKIEKNLGEGDPLSKIAIERLWRSGKNKDIRVSVKDRLTKYFNAIGIVFPGKLNQDLLKTIALRNKIVHHRQTEKMNKETAYHAVDVGMNVIDHSLSVLLGE